MKIPGTKKLEKPEGITAFLIVWAGQMVSILGGIVGTGSGAGMAVIYLMIGLPGLMVVVVGYSVYHIREAENLLTDFDSSKQGVTA